MLSLTGSRFDASHPKAGYTVTETPSVLRRDWMRGREAIEPALGEPPTLGHRAAILRDLD